MTASWTLRPAGPEDLPAIVEIVRVEDLKYRGRSDIDLDVTRERLAADPDFDVERDQVVVESGGAVVAAAVINPASAMIAVDPEHDSQGLRIDLLTWSARRQAELHRDICVAVPAANTAASALLLASGYELKRFYAEMVRDFALSGPPEPAQVPAGYLMRDIDPIADLVALHAVDDRAFRERPDYAPETLEEYDKRHVSVSRFAPEWSLLVEAHAGGLGGSLIGFRRPGREAGYIAVLGVDPDHRRRGIARSLLLGAFGAIHAAGFPAAELHVASDNDSALDLYTGVGMCPGERINHYMWMG